MHRAVRHFICLFFSGRISFSPLLFQAIEFWFEKWRAEFKKLLVGKRRARADWPLDKRALCNTGIRQANSDLALPSQVVSGYMILEGGTVTGFVPSRSSVMHGFW